MKKRISLKEWEHIGQLNHARKIFRPLCSYFLTKDDEGNFVRLQYINFSLYVLLFVPLHLLQIACLAWDGGLKDFEIVSRYLGRDTLRTDSPAWEKANEIWEGKK